MGLFAYDAATWTCFLDYPNWFVPKSSERYRFGRRDLEDIEETTEEEVDGCCFVNIVGVAFESGCTACIRI